MQPDEILPPPGAPGERPVYPTEEFYRQLAAQRDQQKYVPPIQTYLPQSPYQPTQMNGAPYRPAPTVAIRPHNAFTRFLVNWGGGQRLLISLGTMALSVVVYYYLWQLNNWYLAIGLTLLLLVHEMGHALALRFKRLPTTFPIFIPGIGAFVSLPNAPLSSRDHIDVALAGPFAGGLGAFFCLVMGLLLPLEQKFFWLQLALWGFFLNLLNLLPVLPLDGGHVAVILSRYLAYIGIGLLVLAVILTHFNFLVIYLAIVGIPMTLNNMNAVRYRMRTSDQVISWAMYLGLTVSLFLGLAATSLIPYFLTYFGA